MPTPTDHYVAPKVHVTLGAVSLDVDTLDVLSILIEEGRAQGMIRRRVVAQIVEAGLQNLALRGSLTDLVESLDHLDSTLSAAKGLDTEPHPCPPHVDSTYWAEKESERMQMVVEALGQTVHEASRLVRVAKSAAKALKG